MISDIDLIKDYKNNNNILARNELVLRYQGAAVNIANKLCMTKYISLADCVQEAYIGLLTSIEYFDLSKKGIKFWNYAYPWVVGKVMDYIRSERRLPTDGIVLDIEDDKDYIHLVDVQNTFDKIFNYTKTKCSKDALEGIKYKLSVWSDTHKKGQRNTYYSEVKRAKYNKAITLLSRQFKV